LTDKKPDDSRSSFGAIVGLLVFIAFIVFGLATFAANPSTLCDSNLNIPGIPSINAVCTGAEIGENLTK